MKRFGDLVEGDSPGRDLCLAEAERACHRQAQPLHARHEARPVRPAQGRSPAVGGQARLRQQGVAEPPRQVRRQHDGQLLLARRGCLHAQNLVEGRFLRPRQEVQLQSECFGARVAADRPADVEHDGARQAEVGEQQRAARRRQRLAVLLDHAHRHVRHGDAAQLGDPRARDRHWHQRRAGRNDGVSQTRRESVAVAGGAAAGVGLPAGRKDHAAGVDGALRRDQSEAVRARLEVADGLFEGEDGLTAAEAAEQGVEHVERLVADGKDLAGFLDLGGDSFGLEQVDGVLHAEDREGAVQEATGRAVGFDDAPVIGGVREVAARAAGHQDLDAGFAVLFQEQDTPAVFRSVDGRQ
jgi:hypothetical protein